ncbi:MAG TPA: polysaccharide biosynthesis protein [Phycisphaerales bacterium]|nr:polysaccharide biosynthesis protein [Phycisphaerales bacterium]HBR19959.1 polysaccharide biosynthesis protein [Phycisphaerales bacterium]
MVKMEENKGLQADGGLSGDSGSVLPIGVLKFRRQIITLIHVGIFAGSLLMAFLLANNMQFRNDWFLGQYPRLLLLFLLVKVVVFGWFKQYQGWWRYVSISDLLAIVKASLISTLVLVILWFSVFMRTESIRMYFIEFTTFSQAVFILDMLATIIMLGGLRMAVRLYHEEFRTEQAGKMKRFLIVGAGNAGEALLRELHRMQVERYDVVGFIDDDPAKQGMNIHGISVLGTVDQLPKVCEKYSVDEIAIAMPSANAKQLRKVVQLCEGTKTRFRTVPSVADIASGRFRVSQIRDVDINDLLGREAIQLDLDMIENYLKNKVILVTGAGGSIGSEMCRQVCQFSPKLLLLVEQSENVLFFIERELRKDYPQVSMETVICDITDKIRVEQIFEKYRPEVVIHAAAHKHVPLMEANPGEAIKNNVIGTRTVADAADKYGAGHFVMISTDKAVNPTSIMGSSKRIAELYIQDLNNTSKTHFVTVRFGNVLGSNGSVVPIFKAQIAAGGPVTITHPEMRRYFMTIPEASQLVLQAATMGNGGEIFVLDMGEPVKIVDLAKELITLSGFRPGEDIEIVFSGMRPGEKLFEELSIAGEDMMPTHHQKIGVWQKKGDFDREQLHRKIVELVSVADTQDYKIIVSGIKQLVPEFIGDKVNGK